jgi:putative addiction module component (TIGR02574 family)
MKLADLPQVRGLSTAEKLQLVGELWQEVAHDLAALQVTPEEKRALDERWAAFLRNPTAAMTLDQFKAKVGTLRG